jgi:outer membrane protein with beta-barrel domain
MNRVCLLSVSVVVCAFVLVAVPTPAQAQWSVSAGYQALHLSGNWVKGGFNVDAARVVSGMWSIAGEFGVAHETTDDPTPAGFNIFNFGGGVRWSPRRDGPAPFAQLLAGLQRSSSETDSDTAFMLQPGGGVHIPLNDRWGVSAQVDYRPVFYREDTVNEVRFVIGARWTGR